MLDRIATLLSAPVSKVEEFADNLRASAELFSWLPLADELKRLGPYERKAWWILFIQQQGFDAETKEQVTREATQKPGRPVEARAVAVRALELYMNGQKWSRIEEALLPHRCNAKNPGESIRREVQLLRRALKRYGIEVKR